MVSVLPGHHDHHHQVQPLFVPGFRLRARRRRWLSRPYLVSKMGKKWHLVYLDYAWGQSTRDAYIEQIKKAGRRDR